MALWCCEGACRLYSGFSCSAIEAEHRACSGNKAMPRSPDQACSAYAGMLAQWAEVLDHASWGGQGLCRSSAVGDAQGLQQQQALRLCLRCAPYTPRSPVGVWATAVATTASPRGAASCVPCKRDAVRHALPASEAQRSMSSWVLPIWTAISTRPSAST